MEVHPLKVCVKGPHQCLKGLLKVVGVAEVDVLVRGQLSGNLLICHVAVPEGHYALVVLRGVIELCLAGF